MIDLTGLASVLGSTMGAWYDFRDLNNLQRLITEWIADWGPDWLASIIAGVLGTLGILGVIGPTLLILIWVERKVIARFQQRYGPNRVGPKGLLQPVADAVKLILKEQLAPRAADKLIFFLPPVLIFVPGVLIWGVLPFGPRMSVADLNVGVLFLLAVSGTTVLVIFMAGWSSNNKYALFGAMRAVAMSISYEVPMVLALLTLVVFSGTMSINGIVQWQQQEDVIFILLFPLSAIAFFFAASAELNRTPADISEAESEIVAGYHTEYSGMRFGLFYAVELGNTLVVSAFIATFFLGGWWLWGLDQWVPSWIILLVKTGAVYFLLIWTRGTLPRLRVDQLMGFCWKALVPATLLFVVVAFVERTLLVSEGWDTTVALPVMAVINIALTLGAILLFARVSRPAPLRRPARIRMAGAQIGGLRAARQVASRTEEPQLQVGGD
ncbi:MAG: NADH-quinone oxidoreductase subunit NuoH [Chloroflexota bacterium]|nr:NADH-quinone oxidoreductase subunit NuoH [Chloroflexota bacterium]